MDRFNLTVLELEGARRWLRKIVETDEGIRAYGREVLRSAIENPDKFEEGVVWNECGPIALSNVLGTLIDKATPDLAAGHNYPRFELAARRFAKGADRFVKPTVRLLGGWFGLPATVLKRERSGQPELLVKKAKETLAKEEKRFAFLNTGDKGLVSKIFELMTEHASWEGLGGDDDPSAGKARRVALLNEDNGFMILAGFSGSYRVASSALGSALSDAFDGYRIPMTWAEFAYDKANEGEMRVLFSRRDPAIGAFEDYASRVLVKGDEVELTLGSTPRPANQPLMFEYAPGAQRDGWPAAKGDSLWRVETQVPHNHDNDMIFDQGFLHAARLMHSDASAEVFIQGGNGVHHIDLKGPTSLWNHLPAGERQPGMPISFMATGPAANMVVGAMWSHVNLGMNAVGRM